MAELPEITPDDFEILVVRELRKAGLEVSDVRRHRRATLPAPRHGYLLELAARLAREGWARGALIACRVQAAPVGRADVESLRGHAEEAGARVGVLFAAAELAPDALPAAEEHGIALLRVVDGRTAFDASGWGPSGHYPAWLPAYLAQLATRDAAGIPAHRLLESGRPDAILDRLRDLGARGDDATDEP